MIKFGSERLLASISFCGFLVLALVFTGNVWGGPHDRRDRNEDFRHGEPRHGDAFPRLPPGYWDVRVGNSRYYYHHGTFYRRGPSGYIVIQAPMGAIILGLPLGTQRIMVGGTFYYTFGGIYYQRVPSGYVVVQPPPVVVQQPAPVVQPPAPVYQRVSVTVERLNVRSGPDANQPVIAQVPRDTVLLVHGSAEGWWYAELPDGRFGWVMSQFTTPLSQPASG